MTRFFSIPGTTVRNSSDANSLGTSQRNPKAEAFYRARERRGADAQVSGFTAGDGCLVDGVPGVVEHEERDRHTGTIETWVRSKGVTRKTKWKQEAPGEIRITESKRVFE